MKISINELKESNIFLNMLFENITSVIFLVDKNVQIQHFNESFTKVFSKEQKEIIGNLCGNVIGCEYPVLEETDCGKTSYCEICSIRKAIINAFKKEDTFKKVVVRNFEINGEFVKKYFYFTTKAISFNAEEMVMLIFDDITDIESNKLELQEYNEKIKRDLALARNVQLNLIPCEVPTHENLDLVAIYNPLDEIGGDLYDIKKIDKDNIGIFICDISGHGVAAAMVTAMVKAIMESSKKLLLSPEKLMDNLNKKLINISDNMFLTAFYGVYNTVNRSLTYVRCAHPYPLIIREGDYVEISEGSGTILGMFDNLSFMSETIFLKEKDKLLLYTDGVTESKNHEGIDFSQSFENIVKTNANKDIKGLIDLIYDEAKVFIGNKTFNDDICMVGMEIK